MNLLHLGAFFLLTLVFHGEAVQGCQDDRELRRRRPARTRAPRVPTREAYLLDLGSSSSLPSSEVIASTLETSMKQLAVSSGRSDMEFDQASTVAEFDEGSNHYKVVCITVFEETNLNGIQFVDSRSARKLEQCHQDRELRRRRDPLPFHPRRRPRVPFHVNKLIEVMNANGVDVQEIYRTASVACTTGPPISLPPSAQTTPAPTRSPVEKPLPTVPPTVSPVVSPLPTVPPNASPVDRPLPTVPPTVSPVENPVPTSFPSASPGTGIPSFAPSHSPSVSSEPSNKAPSDSVRPTSSPRPSESFQPSLSNAPSLPPPDWEPFGSVIVGRTEQKVDFSNNGTLLGAVFTNCLQSSISGNIPCARVYFNPNLGNWTKIGGDIFAPGDLTMKDMAFSGDGSAAAFAVLGPVVNGNRPRSVQVLEIPGFTQVGSTVTDELENGATEKTTVCLSEDAGLLTLAMATSASGGQSKFQAWEKESVLWSTTGEALELSSSFDASFSGDCRTLALRNTTISLIYRLLDDGTWDNIQEGFPGTQFASLELDSTGSIMAARTQSPVGKIDIYELSANVWSITASILSGQVFEGNFGFVLDMSSSGTTTGIATFRTVGGQTIGCCQAFAYNGTSWLPKGRPPCRTANDGHPLFGAFLAISGEGQTMAIGDVNPGGHIHTYQFIETLED